MDIVEKYKEKELTAEEANEKLKEAGEIVRVRPLTDEERVAKQKREDEAGFVRPAVPEPDIVLDRPDMRRKPDKAGTTEIQITKSGRFEVFYNENGYATKAVRVRG